MWWVQVGSGFVGPYASRERAIATAGTGGRVLHAVVCRDCGGARVEGQGAGVCRCCRSCGDGGQR